MWVSIVVVSIRVRFFVFGGSGKNDIVRICCNGVFCFCGEFGYFLEILPNFFVSLTVSVKMSYILCFVTYFATWGFQIFLICRSIYLIISPSRNM